MAIITLPARIAEATAADLILTFNALTGCSVESFDSRAIAERRVEMAILAAKDADARTGVPKNTDPRVRTRKDIEAKAAERGIEPPAALEA